MSRASRIYWLARQAERAAREQDLAKLAVQAAEAKRIAAKAAREGK